MKLVTLMLFAFFALSILGPLPAPADDTAKPQPAVDTSVTANTPEEREVIGLVQKAADSFATKGKDYTIKLLNAGYGPFRKKELYVFAIDMKGKILSHPTNAKLRGANVWNLKDTKGKLFVQDFIKTVKGPGQGWVDYWWKRVNEDKGTLKRSYVMKVPSQPDLFVGCGYYVK